MKTPTIILTAIISLNSGIFANSDANAKLKKLTDIEVKHETAEEHLESQKDKTSIQKLQSPIIIKSLDDALKHFNREALENVAEHVDFETQELLVFIWNGSGKDQLTSNTHQTSPPQIKFDYTPGTTKDLRTHVSVFAKPINAKWVVSPKQVVRFRCGVGLGDLKIGELQGGGVKRRPIQLQIQGQPRNLDVE